MSRMYLMSLGSKPTDIDWKSTVPSVFPAKAGIQALRDYRSISTLDARWSLPPTLIGGGHDGSFLCLKHALSAVERTMDFNHPREQH